MSSAVIADDHPVVRAAVRILLKQEGFSRIIEVSSGNEVVPAIREHKPDVVVLDLDIPGLDGLGVLGRIQASDVRCRVVVFTGQDADYYQERCMRAGAVAYVSKTNDLQHLHKAIHAVRAGYSYFIQLRSSSVSMSALERSEKEMIDKLSDRELTIFQHLARGKGNKDIAELMNLSHKTVSTYKTRVVEKLNVESKVHLRDFAKRNHLI
ncbi:Virulence factors putative positive transcription regulator BvgA [compost metagenome]